ncbi:MAG: hypothetical protein JWO22_81 [Frankiales bacterium]|nr:hypothetical protein [Frankiales bacterium]
MISRPRVAAALATAATAFVLAPGLSGTARADVTRCVGATGVPGASACYTSPRTDHIGLVTTSLGAVPVVCYGLGCTGATLLVYAPGGDVSGRFSQVTYLGNTYTVYRPAEGQPYVVKNNSGSFQPVEDVQELLIQVALDASQA